MNQLRRYLKGDKYLWAFISLLALFSFLPVYSASTNLVVLYGSGTVFKYLFKHAFSLIIGFVILFFTQLIKPRYFGVISLLALPLVSLLLFITVVQSFLSEEGNATRWLTIPLLNFSFQPSTIAFPCLFIYCSRYLAKNKDKKISLKKSFWPLLGPIFMVVALILPTNGSSALILFVSVLCILFLGAYPFKNILIITFSCIVAVTIFIFTALNWGDKLPIHRVHTWKNRIEHFFDREKEENYQVKRAKAAIVLGSKFGQGPGKSALKTILPQSSSDFIYAIIIEEYGLVGGIILLFIYLLILLRILIIATKLEDYFERLLVLALGLPIILQTFVNMGVAINLLPVTGQTLPLISAGGTSIWMTCFSFGVILSASKAIKKNKLLYDEEKSDPFTS